MYELIVFGVGLALGGVAGVVVGRDSVARSNRRLRWLLADARRLNRSLAGRVQEQGDPLARRVEGNYIPVASSNPDQNRVDSNPEKLSGIRSESGQM